MCQKEEKASTTRANQATCCVRKLFGGPLRYLHALERPPPTAPVFLVARSNPLRVASHHQFAFCYCCPASHRRPTTRPGGLHSDWGKYLGGSVDLFSGPRVGCAHLPDRRPSRSRETPGPQRHCLLSHVWNSYLTTFLGGSSFFIRMTARALCRCCAFGLLQ